MEISISVALPRDSASVPVVRRVLVKALDALGAEPECRDDVELALAEACANVLNHAQAGDEYKVVGYITDDRVTLEVHDAGVGFDSAGRGLADADETSESGRGIQLMRALVDSVSFTARPDSGTVVHLVKMLRWRPDAVVKAVTQPDAAAS